MNKKHLSLCLFCACLAVFQMSVSAQQKLTIAPKQTVLPSNEAKSCVILMSGEPSKLVEAVHGNKFEEFKKLIADGEDLNAFDRDFETPLMAAASYKRVEFVRELVKANADVNKANSIGWTALMWAVLREQSEIVKILLDAGADVDAENQDGTTALLFAARDGNLETVEALLSAGANLHKKNKRGQTALLLSAEGGKADVLKKLLFLGFDPNSYSDGGYTALVGAARYPEILKTLLAAGAKPNLQFPQGAVKSMTALEVAAQNGWTESVRVLLEAGADPNLYYTPDRLPLDKALQKNYTEIVELLKANGAKQWQDFEKQ